MTPVCFYFLIKFYIAKDSKSEYINEYHEHPNISEHNMGDKLGLKHSHFTVGEDDPKQYYLSMYKRDHVEFKNIAVAQLEAALKNDLRRHHWEYGTLFYQFQHQRK